MIACIICGGVGEVMLVMAGCGWIINWFKKRHDRKKCKCCQKHDVEKISLEHYLTSKGYIKDIADDICKVYEQNGIDGVTAYTKKLNDKEHDYTDEFVGDVREWKNKYEQNSSVS